MMLLSSYMLLQNIVLNANCIAFQCKRNTSTTTLMATMLLC